MRELDEKQTFVAAIAAEHGRRLRRYLAARLHNTADAPDLAQEVYLRLLRLGEHELVRNPEAYLFTVASHLVHEHTLRQANLPPMVDLEDLSVDLPAAARGDPLLEADMQQRLEELECAIVKLSPKARAALVLHRRDGFSIEEVGMRIGVSRNVAKKYLAKALKYCRGSLCKDER